MFSYLELRQAVGWIGLTFPFILVIGAYALPPHRGLQSSISAYYYTAMGNVFVGLLCAIGVFHLATEGYDRADRTAGRLACLFALGVAWFPTTRDCPPPTPTQNIIGDWHYAFAALLFGVLAFFCLRQFPQTTNIATRTQQKKERNAVYYICGWTIAGCIAVIGSVKVFKHFGVLVNFRAWLDLWKWNFWFESLALIAFGVAFLVKGEFILKDDPSPVAPVRREA